MDKGFPQGFPDFYQAIIQSWQEIGRKNPFIGEVKELDRYIHELKAVELWLQSNQQLLRHLIQTLEMQQAALHTFKPWGGGQDNTGTPNFDSGSYDKNLQSWWQLLQHQFTQITQLALASGNSSTIAETPPPAKRKRVYKKK